MRILLGLASCCIWLTATGCGTPCGQLREHAETCGAASGRYVAEDVSACAATRRELGPKTFDTFAACVDEAACDDRAAIDRCAERHAQEAAIQPCSYVALWSAGCGLEPLLGQDACESLEGTPGQSLRNDWLECVTADGCPGPTDGRFESCGVLPTSVQPAAVEQACSGVADQALVCASNVDPTVTYATALQLCYARAATYSVASYTTYATCLSAAPCGDAAALLFCETLLRLS